MKKYLVADLFAVSLFAVSLFAGCMVGPGPHGSGGIVVVPALPSIVVLEAEPYYQHGGYFYFFENNRWSYSSSRRGPWIELPKDRYPKEVKFKHQDDNKSKGQSDDKNKGEHRGQGKRDKN